MVLKLRNNLKLPIAVGVENDHSSLGIIMYRGLLRVGRSCTTDSRSLTRYIAPHCHGFITFYVAIRLSFSYLIRPQDRKVTSDIIIDVEQRSFILYDLLG